jgi:hypothetical protein
MLFVGLATQSAQTCVLALGNAKVVTVVLAAGVLAAGA